MTLVATHGLSVVRACRVAGLSRAAYYTLPSETVGRDADVIAALTTRAADRPRGGLWRWLDRLRLDGHGRNWKRVSRVYRALRFHLPRRTKRRLPTRAIVPLDAPHAQPHAGARCQGRHARRRATLLHAAKPG